MANTCFDPERDGLNSDRSADLLADPFRRLLTTTVLATSGGALASAGIPLPSLAAGSRRAAGSLLPFGSLPVSTEDKLFLPNGYRSHFLYAWGAPLSDGPRAKTDASDSAAEQMKQAGMHHDSGWPQPLRQYSAPGRNRRRAQRRGQADSYFGVASQPVRRCRRWSSALRHGGHQPSGWQGNFFFNIGALYGTNQIRRLSAAP